MVSSHFPSLYAQRWSWLTLFILVAAGAAVRYVMNVRFTYQNWVPALGGTVATAALLLYLLVTYGGGRAGAAESANSQALGAVTFADARVVIDRRCAACHSRQPSDVSLGVMPGGVTFDTPEEIVARAARIRERAVVTRTMPPGNKTRITDRERAVLARWIEQGSPVP